MSETTGASLTAVTVKLAASSANRAPGSVALKVIVSDPFHSASGIVIVATRLPSMLTERSVLPLAVGQALTFAVAYYMLHQLNASSSAFTALLMGLGTDFTIVMYARYVEERRAGKSLAEATELMVGETGLGVFTGAITSAGTFYAMCVSRFRGLFDLGFLIGTGILLCAVAILFLLPAMITWNEGVRRRKVDSVRKLHLQSFGLGSLKSSSFTPRSADHEESLGIASKNRQRRDGLPQ